MKTGASYNVIIRAFIERKRARVEMVSNLKTRKI